MEPSILDLNLLLIFSDKLGKRFLKAAGLKDL
jgi:hypothetical protein